MAIQLGLLERDQTSQMHDARSENDEVARATGARDSTISRKLRRNALTGEYTAMIAQRICR